MQHVCAPTALYGQHLTFIGYVLTDVHNFNVCVIVHMCVCICVLGVRAHVCSLCFSFKDMRIKQSFDFEDCSYLSKTHCI